MEDLQLHQDHAKKLLSDAGVNLVGDSAAEVDPQLAYAQAATNALKPQIEPVKLEQRYAPVQPQISDIANQPPPNPNAPPAPDPAAPPDPAGPPAGPHMPHDLIAGPADSSIYAAMTRDKATAYTAQDAKAAEKIVNDTVDVEKQQAAAEKPHIEAMTKESQASYNRMQAVTQAVQTQQDARMQHFDLVQKEMQHMANEQPMSLMGQAGVNSILGNIAIFLGGAGVNGFHENKNLQMIQSMADRNVAAQKNRFEMLQRVGQGDSTIYGMLSQKLQNSMAVETTLNNAYKDVYASQLKGVLNQFQDKRSQLRGQTLLQGIEESKHDKNLLMRQNYLASANQAITLADTQEMNRLKSQAELRKEELERAKYALELRKDQDAKDLYQKENGFMDLTGTVKGTEHKGLAESWGGARRIVEGLDKAQELIKADPGFKNARTFAALKAINLGAAKKYFDTGQRLEGAEVKMMEAVGLSFTQFMEAMATGGGGLSGTQIAAGYKTIQALVAQDAFTTVQSGAPNVQWGDPNSLMGKFNPAVYKFDFHKEAENNFGPNAGRDRVDQLGQYNAGEGGPGQHRMPLPKYSGGM